MLFNEPKLLKSSLFLATPNFIPRFSALQRAEIAERTAESGVPTPGVRFSALQRAEIAEIYILPGGRPQYRRFSALQRAEIAEN